MNHVEWDLNITNRKPVGELRKEHNATIRAYRDTMAECERLGKANDEACDRIHALEGDLSNAVKNAIDRLPNALWKDKTATEAVWLLSLAVAKLESRPVLTWGECEAKLVDLESETDYVYRDFVIWLKSRLPAPTDSIRVPFSDEQIERMARAACESWHGLPSYTSYHDAGKQEWRDSIRAAIAAGGLVPCAVPEYAPEDVAFPINSTIERNMQLEKECERITERMALVSAKSARRRVALKALNRTVAGQSDLIQRFLRAGKEPVRPEPAAHGCPVSSPAVSKAMDRFWAKRKELGHQTPPAPVWTDEQIEALAKAICRADDDESEDSWMYAAEWRKDAHRKEARAAFAHIGAPARPEGMPSVGELAEVLHKAEPHMPPATYRERNEAMARAILAALAPWLREPTGWELDVTAEEMEEAREKYTYDEYNTPNWEMLQWLRSRIRPTFECAECAGKTAKLKALDDAIAQLAARAALEGE